MILGIDLGSRNVKVCLMNKNRKIEYLNKFDTVLFYREYGTYENNDMVVNFNKLGITEEFEKIEKIVSTGYGRNNINVKNAEKLSELKAHFLGAYYRVQEPNFTLLDIGGQDTKIIRVENAKMVDFYTNDKCAAGSGRYLENMASLLGIGIEELSKHFKNPVELNNTCAIFGESELIGRIVEGHNIEELCAGINYSVFKRAESYLKKYTQDKLIFTGGVARNAAIAEIIRENTNYEVLIPQEAVYNGAIGCCFQGYNSLEDKR